MNKLIIIGNGFDLAHNMKTSYIHFLENIFNEEYTNIRGQIENDNVKSYNKRVYKTEFMSISFSGILIQEIMEIIERAKTINDLIYECREVSKRQAWYNQITNTYIEVSAGVNFSNKLYEKCVTKANNNWTDIESLYYDELKSTKNLLETQQLNKDFDILKNRLELYLSSLPLPTPNKIYKRILMSEISKKESKLIVTFNYTKTLDKYNLNKKDYNIIHIHGEIII